MTWLDMLSLAGSSFRGEWKRTLLTILGLTIGVGAVLTVIALGEAGELRVEGEIAKLGVNKVWIRSADERHGFDDGDIANLRRQTNAAACAGTYVMSVVYSSSNQTSALVAGFDEHLQTVHSPRILAGRLFRVDEFEEASSVCLIDETLSEALGGQHPGSGISLGNRRFRVVGVINNMAMQTMSSGGGLVVLPLRTLIDTYPDERIDEITLSLGSNQNAAEVAQTATVIFQDGFRVETLAEEIDAAREIVRIFVMVLLCVAIICMLTGCVGVMNIMLLSLRERRQEIGIMKAIGATDAQIGMLFLTEAANYTLLGGGLGIVVGFMLTLLLGRMIGLECAVLPWRQLIPVLLVSGASGVLFGVCPAIKAARMPPIISLRST